MLVAAVLKPRGKEFQFLKKAHPNDKVFAAEDLEFLQQINADIAVFEPFVNDISSEGQMAVNAALEERYFTARIINMKEGKIMYESIR